MKPQSGETWLVAYDIREPRRLRKVHRCLRRAGLGVQYSAFCVAADDLEIGKLLRRVEKLIDASADDVRAYHVPRRCQVWQLGRQQLPEGVYIEGARAAEKLLAVGAGLDDESAGDSHAEPAR